MKWYFLNKTFRQKGFEVAHELFVFVISCNQRFEKVLPQPSRILKMLQKSILKIVSEFW